MEDIQIYYSESEYYVKYYCLERNKFQCHGKIGPHSPSLNFSVLKVGVPPVKCYGDAGNNEIHEVVAIRKVMGWFLKTECLIPTLFAGMELLQGRDAVSHPTQLKYRAQVLYPRFLICYELF